MVVRPLTPQAAYPYADLVAENQKRSRHELEYELLDTGIFDDNRLLFTENETNYQSLFNIENNSPYTKDGINNYVVNGDKNAVNPHSLISNPQFPE